MYSISIISKAWYFIPTWKQQATKLSSTKRVPVTNIILYDRIALGAHIHVRLVGVCWSESMYITKSCKQRMLSTDNTPHPNTTIRHSTYKHHTILWHSASSQNNLTNIHGAAHINSKTNCTIKSHNTICVLILCEKSPTTGNAVSVYTADSLLWGST